MIDMKLAKKCFDGGLSLQRIMTVPDGNYYKPIN